MKSLLSHIVTHLLTGRTLMAMVLAAVAAAGLASAASAAPASHSSGDRVYSTASNLRVRSGPGTGYRIKTHLSYGQRVRLVSGPVYANGYSWYKVTGYNSSGSTGWSAGKYLSHTRPGGGGTATGATYRVKATAYNGAEFGSDGIMANGKRVHWGAVAVDPRYIPMGTKMYISGFGDKVFEAEDKGSAIKGWRIDIWFPSVQEARNFGVQMKDITIIR